MPRLKLEDHQKSALNRMKNGCILCGGVGSGKSLTSLAYYFKEQGGDIEANPVRKMVNPRDLYIITTARKRDELEWDGELTYFTLSTDSDVNAYKNKVVIDSWNNIGKYSKVYGAFFIFDEQRVIGNGAWVKAFYKIANKNRWILLSATPGDTWSDYIPVFVANGFYKNKTEFTDRHCVYSRFSKYPKIDRYLEQKHLYKLKDSILIKMEFERHTIPHHEDILVDYDRDAYRELTKTRFNVEKNEPIKSASELCYAWRKLVNSHISRRLELLKIIEKHPKIIVFYNFNYELEIIRSTLDKIPSITVAEWNGHIHEKVPTTNSWVYLVQYTAGNEGWNCITTNCIVFYSLNYSYRVMTQAAGRIDRLNTPYIDLYYYYFKSKSPIDLGISRAIQQKKIFNASNHVKMVA